MVAVQAASSTGHRRENRRVYQKHEDVRRPADAVSDEKRDEERLSGVFVLLSDVFEWVTNAF